MNQTNYVLNKLRQERNRLTHIRKVIIEIFSKKTKPLSAIELQNQLTKQDVNHHKTTIYRELEFLKNQGVIQDIQFINEREARYEFTSLAHHHHFVCTDCGDIQDLKLSSVEDALRSEQAQTEKKMKIKIQKHALEFFGLCAKCA